MLHVGIEKRCNHLDSKLDGVDLEAGFFQSDDKRKKLKAAKDRKRELESKFGSANRSSSASAIKESISIQGKKNGVKIKNNNLRNMKRIQSTSSLKTRGNLFLDEEKSMTTCDSSKVRNKSRTMLLMKRPPSNSSRFTTRNFSPVEAFIKQGEVACDSNKGMDVKTSSYIKSRTKTKTLIKSPSPCMTQTSHAIATSCTRQSDSLCRPTNVSVSSSIQPMRGRSIERTHSINSNGTQRYRSQSRDEIRHKSTSARPSLRRGQSAYLTSKSNGEISVAFNRPEHRRRELKRAKSLDTNRKHSRTLRGASVQRSRSTSRTLSGFRIASTKVNRGEDLAFSSRPKTETSGNGTAELHSDEYGRRFERKMNDTKHLHSRTLILVWTILVAELSFDLATTVVAFLSLVRESSCCGKSIELVFGNIALGMTIPFFVLVVIELLTLLNVIILTLSSGNISGSFKENENESKLGWRWRFCAKMNSKTLRGMLNHLVLLNPIFGCMIAWMLMYQSDKKEAFIVLGLEGASLLLHFLSVILEGSFRTCKQILLQSTPLIPFLVSIGMVGYYIKQGGICYSAEEKLFRFSGCEICNVDGVPTPCPKNFTQLWSSDTIKSIQDIGDVITKRTYQSTYCSTNTNFCFFNYTIGLEQNANANFVADILT